MQCGILVTHLGRHGKKIMFNNVYCGKKVLITGNTGFKGSWLTEWLLRLGAAVVGYSKDIPTKPSMFEDSGLESRIKHYFGDVRDYPLLKSIIDLEKPDFIFHLAAQAIVSVSYDEPVETISTNAIGSINLLEAVRRIDWPCIVIMITSDKAYDNVEWVWGYRETDAVGGSDVYSGSKGAAEVLINCYLKSFFLKQDLVRVGIGRAGNVIGGGDWAKDRIVVDIMRSWSKGVPVEIRSPQATRPWQHVLEPLSGYLNLGMKLFESNSLNGEAFNFGPRTEQNRTVVELLQDLANQWGFGDMDNAYQVVDSIPFHEAGLLKLNCDKAMFYMKWEANLSYAETVEFISYWYKVYFDGAKDLSLVTLDQLAKYEALAKNRGRSWALH